MQKPSTTPYSCRLFVLLAREAPLGLIFRHGPHDWTQLILWHTDRDVFQEGQWFKGRIYERRSDLSPDGSKLIYFVRKINPYTKRDPVYTYAWTAISKPPYLTALALWPKGNCWHGGGLFEDNQHVWLNHNPEAAIPHPNHQPVGLDITPNPEAHGEDYPVWSRRMKLDGWSKTQNGVYRFQEGIFLTGQTEIWEKPSPKTELVLVYELLGIKCGGSNLLEAFRVRTIDGQVELKEADWADWDQQGRLVFTHNSILFTATLMNGIVHAHALADFYNHQPEEVISPEWARTW
jgi:hypothetical protein